MKLYYSDVLSPHKACAVARYLKSPVEFVCLDLVKANSRRRPISSSIRTAKYRHWSMASGSSDWFLN
jgi:hypothetical protein